MLFCFFNLFIQIGLWFICFFYFILTFSRVFELFGWGKFLLFYIKFQKLFDVALNLWFLIFGFLIKLHQPLKNKFFPSFNLLSFKVDICDLINNFILFISYFSFCSIGKINLICFESKVFFQCVKFFKFIFVVLFCAFNICFEGFKIFCVFLEILDCSLRDADSMVDRV